MDAAAQMRRGVATRRRKVKRGHGVTLIHEQSLSIHKRDEVSLCLRDSHYYIFHAKFYIDKHINFWYTVKSCHKIHFSGD